MKSRRDARAGRARHGRPIRSFSRRFPFVQASPLRPVILRPVIRRFALLGLFAACALAPAAAQPYASYADFADALGTAAALVDAGDREAAVDAVWSRVTEHGQVPFTDSTTVAFLHRGAAGTVFARGDHNAWGSAGDGPLVRVGLSDVWQRVETLPADARVDYKLVVDGNWRLDPHNPLQQWGGFGPNSELRMPAYVPSPETVRGDGVPAGTFRNAQVLPSARLGYSVRYRVWTPAGYEADPDLFRNLPVLFVTDGHEYADDRLGAALPVLDNLVAEGRIQPPVVVFVDPRDPVSGTNRRQEQYVANPAFAGFVADELAPLIDAAYRTAGTEASRGVLGTSLGGVCALYFAAERPDAFRRIGTMSPALWAAPQLYDALAGQSLSQHHFLSAGTLFDRTDNARAMRDVLSAPGYELTYAERNEGHSWGQWRALMAPMLEALFPPIGFVLAEAPASADAAFAAWPNPARDHVTLHLTGAPHARLDAFDLLGRRVARLHDGPAHDLRLRVDVRGWAPGLYVLRLTTPEGLTTHRLHVSR